MTIGISLSQAQLKILSAFVGTGTAQIEVTKTVQALETKGMIIFAEGEWRLTDAGLREARLYALVGEESASVLQNRTHEARSAKAPQAKSKPASEAAEPQHEEDGTVYILRRGRKYILRYPVNIDLKSKDKRTTTIQVFANAAEAFVRSDAEGVFKPSVDILWQAGLLERSAEDSALFRITPDGAEWLAKQTAIAE